MSYKNFMPKRFFHYYFCGITTMGYLICYQKLQIDYVRLNWLCSRNRTLFIKKSDCWPFKKYNDAAFKKFLLYTKTIGQGLYAGSLLET